MINITLVDDHPIVREGVRNLIETDSFYRIIEEFDNAEDFLNNVKSSKSQLLITDISLPGMSGIKLTDELRKKSYQSKIIVFSMHDDKGYIKEAFDSGADGYLLKDCNREELFKALQEVINGNKYIGKSALKSISGTENEHDNQIILSGKEKQIIKLLAQGIKSNEIAKRLNLSTRTVSNRRYKIMHKLKVKNSSELIAKAIRDKII